jgi:arsenate reductase
MSVDFTILHNPRCSTSRAALENLEASDRSFEVVPYLKQPLAVDQLRDLVALFPDSPTDLVRRDPNFAKLGLTDDDVRTPDQVVTALAEHPELLQRPILIRHDPDGDRAIIGCPKQAVPDFLKL